MNNAPPDRCENCGYSEKYSKQEPGEALKFCGVHRVWTCQGCRDSDAMGCTIRSHPLTENPVVMDLLKSVPVNDGIYGRISDLVYHADPDSLSSSGARLLLPPKTPAHFWEEQNAPPKVNKVYDFGHAAHKMVLGMGSDLFMLDPAVHGVDAKGKPSSVPAACGKWKAAAAKARNEGRIPLPKSEIQIAQRMAGVVYAHPIASKLLGPGTPEVSGYWHDDATGVRCRFRPDYLPDRPGRMIIVDYKSADDASQDGFEYASMKYGYYIQDAWYREGVRQCEIDDDPAFVFIVQEKKPPFEVNVFQHDPEHVELGARQMRRAIETFAQCAKDKKWPGYDRGIHTARLPGYAVKRIETSLESETSTLT